jgi:CheY-like chemotaxis protein
LFLCPARGARENRPASSLEAGFFCPPDLLISLSIPSASQIANGRVGMAAAEHSRMGLLVTASRRVLLVVEDPAMGELLLEALTEAGHQGELVGDREALLAALGRACFDAAIVDVDTRAHDGKRLIATLRAEAPHTAVIALLPCGGLAPGAPRPDCQLAIEKPARLRTLLSALTVAQLVTSNGWHP